jgi:TM2 domain-containing membrane protein YozV/uncharacterized protein YraI
MIHLLSKIQLFILLFLISSQVLANDIFITDADLNLRSGPGTEYSSIEVIKIGEQVEVLEYTNDNWVKIKYNYKIGYSYSKFLTRLETEGVETSENNSNSITVIIIIIICALIFNIIISREGEKHRDKSSAFFLALLFGGVGVHCFYLGQRLKGILYLIFCWTYVPIFLGIFDALVILFTSKDNFNAKFNTSNSIKTKTRTQSNIYSTNKTSVSNRAYSSNSNYSDIIDVRNNKYDLNIEKNDNHINTKVRDKYVPYWNHMYVYSYGDLRSATKKQKEFYFQYRKSFLEGKLLDIEENTNYAFILYFDLLNEYENHKDIKLLEEQLKLLGQSCPKTKGYSLSSLMDLMRRNRDSYSVNRYKEYQDPSFQFEQGFLDYDPDAYKLGKKYKDTLGLNDQEVKWLNKIWNPYNVFISIEGCCITTIMLYLQVLNYLSESLKNSKTSINKEVNYFKKEYDKLYKERYGNGWDYYDENYYYNQAESDVFYTIFKRTENAVRKAYEHKRKVSGAFPGLDKNLIDEFEQRIGQKINELITEHEHNIVKPDLETQIELNSHNVNRWKEEFKTIKESFDKEKITQYIEMVKHLERVNKTNPNIENIFFESSKFIAKYDKVLSLQYYVKYIYYDLKSKKFDNKQLTKTVLKSLFKNDDQINTFKSIIENLIQTSDIKTALKEVPKVYFLKRKRIKLNESEIEEIEEKHSATVEILNEYLDSGSINEPQNITVDIESNENDFQLSIKRKEEPDNTSLNIEVNEVQEKLINLFTENAFVIEKNVVEKLAIESGLFKNQLIDSINEACFEILDGEALIEEDEENYVIEESFYNELIKN